MEHQTIFYYSGEAKDKERERRGGKGVSFYYFKKKKKSVPMVQINQTHSLMAQ